MTNSATDFKNFLDFYGGMVDKNLPVSAWDTHLILGSEKSHMPQRNQAHEPQLQSLLSRAHELQLVSPHLQLLKPTFLEPLHYNWGSHCNEELMHCNKE